MKHESTIVIVKVKYFLQAHADPMPHEIGSHIQTLLFGKVTDLFAYVTEGLIWSTTFDSVFGNGYTLRKTIADNQESAK